MGGLSQLYQALTISILAHLVLVLLLDKTPTDLNNQGLEPVEVEFIDESQAKGKQQFVTDTEAGELITKADQAARFVSKDNRRVKEESIAALSGPTQNKKSRAEKVLKSETLSLKDLLPDNGEIALKKQKRSVKEADQGLASLLSDVSTISEYIPGVRTGKFTALNTDQITYYTFFSRINEQLRNRWTGNIRRVSSVKSKTQLQQWSVQSRITEVEIVLDKKGRYIKSRLFKASGVPDLDWAAVDAFKDAAPFTNPPVELIGDDGLVRLQYSFYVEWKAIN